MINNKAMAFLFALLAFQSSLSFAEEEILSLTIHVSGATPGKGQAICALFSSPENYLKEPMMSRTQPVDASGQVIFHFERLTAGTYAVSVVYDEDLNGKLNTGLLGIPTELVGMSNNAKGTFGPPTFEHASFALSQSLAIDIVLDQAKD